jgi:hypothetical protein
MTDINRNLEQFKTYKYPVTARLIPKGGQQADELDLSQGVSGVRILKDYDKHVLPYISLSLLLSTDELDKLQKNWRDGKLYLTIGKSTVPVGPGSSDEVDTGQPYMTDCEFQIMTMPSSPSTVPSGQISDQARSTQRMGVMLEVIPTTALSINKKLNGGAYHGATTTDMVSHLVQQNAPQKPGYAFHMAPHDNDRVHESVVLPPMSFSKAIQYLDEVHGIYGGTTHVFLDHDHAVITSSAKTIGAPAGAPQRIAIECGNAASGTPELTGGSGFDPAALVHRLRTAQILGISVQGPANQENNGENVKLVGSNLREQTGSDCQMLTPSGTPLSGTPKEKIVWQGYDNPLMAQKMSTRARERYAPAMVSFQGADLAAFDPKLPLTVQAGDPAQQASEGNWRLAACEFVLTRQANSKGSCSASVAVRVTPAANGTGPSSDGPAGTA